MFGRKRDFKPDKTGTNPLRQLHLTQRQRAGLLKWSLCGLVVAVLSVVQDVILCRISVRGATTDLTACAIQLLGIMAGVESGTLFVVIAAVCYFLSGMAPGVYCILYLTVLSCGMNMFRRGYLRSSPAITLVCAMAALLVYELLIFVTGLIFGLTTPARLTGFCITAGMSCLLMPLLYPVFAGLGKIGGNPWNE